MLGHLKELETDTNTQAHDHSGKTTTRGQFRKVKPALVLKTLFLVPLTFIKKFGQWLFYMDKTTSAKRVSLISFFSVIIFISFERGLVRYLIHQALHVKIVTENQTSASFLNQVEIEVLEHWRKSFPVQQTLEYFMALLIIWITVLATSWFSSVITRARSWDDEYDDPPELKVSLKNLSIHFTIRILGLLALYHLVMLACFYLMSGGRMEVILTSFQHLQALMNDPIRTTLPMLAQILDLMGTIVLGISSYLYFQFHRNILSATKVQAFLLCLPPIILMWFFNVV